MARERRVAIGARAAGVLLLIGTVLPGCSGAGQYGSAPHAAPPAATQPAGETSGKAAAPRELAGTEWRLVEFQSMDDAQGTERPGDPSLYTMFLRADGSVAMRLNCNRATGTWEAHAGPGGTSGQFTFGPMAATQALCPPPSMDERVAAQTSFVRSYVLKDGRLHLSLMADGGIVVWEPAAQPPIGAAPVK